jgi:hypothetical protein
MPPGVSRETPPPLLLDVAFVASNAQKPLLRPLRLELSRSAEHREMYEAKELGMSNRTLQRRITDEGTSFRQLLSDARHSEVRLVKAVGRSATGVADPKLKEIVQNRGMRRKEHRTLPLQPPRSAHVKRYTANLLSMMA